MLVDRVDYFTDDDGSDGRREQEAAKGELQN